MTEPVVDVGDEDFEVGVVARSREVPVVVDFWADWCQPCRVLGPILERLAGEYSGRFQLARVDIDANPGLARAFGIQGIPAVKAFVDGQVVSEFLGAQPEQMVRAFLDSVVPPASAPIMEEARSALRAGNLDEARRLAESVPAGGDARALRAEIELRSAAPDTIEEGALRERAGTEPRAALALAAREAVAEHPESALERCMALVDGDGEGREAARETMVLIFDLLGDDHPLTRQYRPRLARALF